MKTAQDTASAQNTLGNPFPFNMLRTISQIVRFFLSATPFYWGE
jgi:hypothetical protein